MMHRQDLLPPCRPSDRAAYLGPLEKSITPTLSAIATGVILSGLGLLNPGRAIANPLLHGDLVAQQVVDGLPPPPPAVGIPPVPGPAQAASENVYLVYVNGDSPLLLDQVRRVTDTAMVQSYQGQQVIQAGVFEEPTSAQQQAAALEAQGILAEVAPVPAAWFAPALPAQTAALPPTPLPPPELVPVTVAPREIEFGRSPEVAAAPIAPPAAGPATTTTYVGQNYYVVIPGPASELSTIAAQVIRLGANIGVSGIVEERTEPVGPHVRVGPFVDQAAANRWSRYFSDFGLNARVYYRR
jgi:hypothetical protein